MGSGLEVPYARWVEFRRELHQYPELSGEEKATAGRVISALEPLDLSLRTEIGGFGVVAELEGGQPGPTVAYRADMDALPIQELSDVPYRSRVPGVMHACGHDVHTAIGVGLAHALHARRDELIGTVRFIFQPAEEGIAAPGEVIGAAAMVLEGAIDGVDAALALHVAPDLENGCFGMSESNVAFATSDCIEIRLKGKTAHGAYPHHGVDTVLMGSAVVQALLALPGRLTSALDPCLLSICSFHAGSAHNILAGEAELKGTLRTFDDETRQNVIEAARRAVEQIAAAHGGSGSLHIKEGARAVHNDQTVCELIREQLARSAGCDRVVSVKPRIGAEDFAAFASEVPACFLFLGVKDPGDGSDNQLHTNRFDVDETCIPFAIGHLTEAVLGLSHEFNELSPD